MSRSQRDVTRTKIRKIINNSARDRSISVKFTRLYDVTCTTNFPGQWVKGQGHSLGISSENAIRRQQIG